jgi:hypothetical protein
MGGPCSTIGEKKSTYRLLMGNPEGKRTLGRPRHRWVDIIRMDLGEVGWGGVDWIVLGQDRDRWTALVSAVMSLRVHKMSGNYRVVSQPVASRVVLSSMESISYLVSYSLSFITSNINIYLLTASISRIQMALNFAANSISVVCYCLHRIRQLTLSAYCDVTPSSPY